MIIILDGYGSVLNKEFERINQGSNNANKIYVVAPWAENTIVNTSFELPNGYVTSNYLMTPLMDINENLGIWELDITDVAMTQFYGIVKFQIKAHIDGKIISTARGKFKVEEGVDWQLPASPDEVTYAQILDALSRTDERFINKVNSNYTDEENEIEQQIINSSLGLKFVKTVGDETTTFEIREDGCFINDKKITTSDDVETLWGLIAQIQSGEMVVGVARESLDTPTKVSELENDSGYVDNSVDNLLNYYLKNQVFTKQETETAINNKGFITKAVDNLLNYYLKAEVYTKQEVNEIVSAIKTISFEVVDELPLSGEKNVIYLLPKTGSTNNAYEEYIYVSNSWEMIGTTEIDLSNYYTKDETDNLLENAVLKTNFSLDGTTLTITTN